MGPFPPVDVGPTDDEVGGEVLLAGGGGGVRGTFSGGMMVEDVGDFGVSGDVDVGDTDATGPGGGGGALLTLELAEPGSTIG
jgi:hypothetical protein